jgi:hypothetical protein
MVEVRSGIGQDVMSALAISRNLGRDLAMTTEDRLEKLERELMETRAGLTAANCRNRWLVAGVVTAAGLLALAWTWTTTTAVAQAPEAGTTPKVIRAREFILEDENGKTRAKLHMSDAGPNLTLFDENGGGRVLLCADRYGARLAMSDEKGDRCIGLCALKEGPDFSMYRGDRTRARLRVLNDGAYLLLLDENITPRAILGTDETVSPDGTRTKHPESSLRLYGPDGKTLWSAP